ncbi:hypothetical protein [Bacillus sp. AK128]
MMIGILGTVIPLFIFLIGQNKNLKEDKKERNKVYFLAALTMGSSLFLVLPYSPSIITDQVNNLFKSISDWMILR